MRERNEAKHCRSPRRGHAATVSEVEAMTAALGTMYQYRSRGGGPRGFRSGTRVLYRKSAVRRWLLSELEANEPVRQREAVRAEAAK